MRGPEQPPPGPRAALLAVACLFLAATIPSGPPPDGLGRRAWDGIGPIVDARLPGSGWLSHERTMRVAGREHPVEVRSRLGHELVVCGLYLAWIPLGVLALRRRGGVPALALRRSDADALLSALALLVPLYCAVLVGTVLVAEAGTLREAVWGFWLPALAGPTTAVWPIVRLLVLAPLAEELLWRGVVFRGLRTALPLAPAAALCALTFALWHWLSGWPIAPLLAQYLFGFVACLLVERTGGLGASIALHALGNGLTVGLYYLCMFRPEEVVGFLGG